MPDKGGAEAQSSLWTVHQQKGFLDLPHNGISSRILCHPLLWAPTLGPPAMGKLKWVKICFRLIVEGDENSRRTCDFSTPSNTKIDTLFPSDGPWRGWSHTWNRIFLSAISTMPVWNGYRDDKKLLYQRGCNGRSLFIYLLTGIRGVGYVERPCNTMVWVYSKW